MIDKNEPHEPALPFDEWMRKNFGESAIVPIEHQNVIRSVTVGVDVQKDIIELLTHDVGNPPFLDRHTKMVIDTQDAMVHAALIKMGWKPPALNFIGPDKAKLWDELKAELEVSSEGRWSNMSTGDERLDSQKNYMAGKTLDRMKLMEALASGHDHKATPETFARVAEDMRRKG